MLLEYIHPLGHLLHQVMKIVGSGRQVPSLMSRPYFATGAQKKKMSQVFEVLVPEHTDFLKIFSFIIWTFGE